MDALISAVVAENNVDPSRIYVGGLSMGSFGMASPMIASTNPDQLPYAAAILVSGASISATQAQVVASKGIPVWLLGNAGDPVAAALFPIPTAYVNLVAAGVDARINWYPPGPTFDGEHYYGAHDTWIYFYRNMVRDDVSGETMFDWLARQSR
jgi:predicted peptidase